MSTVEITEGNCEAIGQILSQILADTYILYLKTQNFHWNVIDPRFKTLHLLFEEQYEELENQIDEIAERIRTLRVKAPGSMQEFLEIGTLREAEGDLTGNQMIEQLLQDHEKLAQTIRPKIDEIIEMGDQGSADMLIQHLKNHEKTAWMLRSHLIEI